MGSPLTIWFARFCCKPTAGWLRPRNWAGLCSVLAIFALSGVVQAASLQSAASQNSAELPLQRQRFLEALAELRTGVGPRYQTLRQQLDDYPLVAYLDFEVYTEQLHDLSPEQAKEYLAGIMDSPLQNRFLAQYLSHKGRDRRWQEFLAVLDEPPRDVELQCYYYRALRETGKIAEAWRGAEALWNVGKSQDKACDPLFERWIGAGNGPSDALIWSRALKAFDARSLHIIKYVRRYASEELKPLLNELISVYQHPDRLVKDAHEPGTAHAQLMTVGIRRLARVNPGQARKALLNAASVQPFTEQQLEAMEKLITRHSLFAASAAPEPWQIETLSRLRDDELTEIFLRKQVEEGHWPDLLAALDWLSDSTRGSDQWRYWRARALEATGEVDLAQAAYRRLAKERSYHGFMAAEKLGLPYALNQPTVESAPPAQVIDDSGIARVRELLALERVSDARLEWRDLLARHSSSEQVLLAQLALDSGWEHMAIQASNTARAWDRIDLRFPEAFTDAFNNAARRYGVDRAELMAIARRESAMYPLAESRVGARGLMQVMPSTGKLVAKKAGLSWRRSGLYEPEYNVRIGAWYYQSLLERFDGHRPKALAGYNAGPHRVERWTDKNLATDQWIDSLPFRETREYVQAVLAYAVIYREQAGETSRVLRANEWSLSNQGKNL